MNLKKIKKCWRREFEKRKGTSSYEAVCTTIWGEYVNVHPFADDIDSNNDFRTDACYQVDAYWRKGGMVVFLEVISAQAAIHTGIGYYARWKARQGPPLLVLHAVVEDEVIYRSTYTTVMKEFNRLGAFRPRVEKHIGEALERLDRGLDKPDIIVEG